MTSALTGNLDPVVIAGAGPTGLMAALELSRFGIPVRLVEKTLSPATTSRAIGVQARTLELLEQRGLSEALVAKGNRARGICAYGGGERVFRLDFEHLDSKYRHLLFVSQVETEQLLRDALARAGVAIEWGTTMAAFGAPGRDEGLTIVLKDRTGRLEEVTAAYAISAEGAHSTVRRTLGLGFEGRSLREDYALGDLHADGDLSDDDLHIFSSTHGFLGLFPLGGRRFRLIARLPPESSAKDAPPSLEQLQAFYDQRAHVPLRLRDLSWSSWFRINSRRVDALRRGRLFLGGDAAHIHSPAGAQGMNTGLQDMVNLCWKLALVMKGQARPELLDTYDAERLPVIRGVLMRTEALTRAIGEENDLFRSVFNHVAPWIVGIDRVRQEGARSIAQLAFDYRGSPFSSSRAPAGALHAGDRLPDLAILLAPDGAPPAPATTFAAMDPSRLTLFETAVSPAARPAADALPGAWRGRMDVRRIAPAPGAQQAFETLFGTSPRRVLVRPDGYVGFIGAGDAPGELADFLDRWFIAAPA